MCCVLIVLCLLIFHRDRCKDFDVIFHRCRCTDLDDMGSVNLGDKRGSIHRCIPELMEIT